MRLHLFSKTAEAAVGLRVVDGGVRRLARASTASFSSVPAVAMTLGAEVLA